MDKRRNQRIKAVLPVRVSGNDIAGDSYSELAHTLDISPHGARLGAVRRQLEVGSQMTVHYRQRKAEFRVVWTKPLTPGGEQQIGLEAGPQKDLWGLQANPNDMHQTAQPAQVASASIRV